MKPLATTLLSTMVSAMAATTTFDADAIGTPPAAWPKHAPLHAR